MREYMVLKRQILYLIFKLENARYFLINNFYKRELTKYKLEIIKKNEILHCFLYDKTTDQLKYNMKFDIKNMKICLI